MGESNIQPPSDPSNSEDKPPVRLAVFELLDGKKIHLATVTLTKNKDIAWTLQANGTSEECMKKVWPVLERFVDHRKALRPNAAEPPEKDAPEALADMMSAEGFVVEWLPNGDHQVSFQIDLNSGTVVGTHAAMHPLAALDDGLGRRVFEAFANGFSKAASDLAEEIDTKLAQDKVEQAVTAIKREMDHGLLGLRPTKRLIESLMRIEVSGLSGPDRRLVRDCRLHLAQRLNRFDIAGIDADAILTENEDTLDAEQIATLKMARALGSLAKGNRETALAVLKQLLSSPSDLNAEGRGWAWRNISLVLSADDPEAELAAQHSADAFLEAGRKNEAGRSLMRLANILLRREPAEAIKKLNEMVDVLGKEGLLDRHVRGAALHARANRLALLNKHHEAFRDASDAVELQRGLIGAEAEFVSSLHLAAIEACRIGETEAADALEAEAGRVTQELKIPHFQLAERAAALVQAFDPKAADEILRDAEAANNLQIIAAVRIFQAIGDKSLNDTARIELLEETLKRLNAAGGANSMASQVEFTLGRQLFLMGQPERAEQRFRRILASNPYDAIGMNGLLEVLWHMEKWRDAATFLRKQMDLRGEMPGLMFAYGKSLFQAGDMSGAVTALTKSMTLAGDNENAWKHANELRERALELGGTILPPEPPKPAAGAVTRDEFGTALDGFARFVAAEKRMGFWDKPSDGDYQWIPRPEKRAQDLLHTALKARFEDRIEVFEEIGTGAGRLDLYVKLEGGLSIVVELKMCGFGYSSNYAAAGEEQINHYMDNRKTHLGYLVVFDARLDKLGQRLLSDARGPHTIIEKLIDVTPRVRRA
jgi:tetratricopeptide (TPR) repeat protein